MKTKGKLWLVFTTFFGFIFFVLGIGLFYIQSDTWLEPFKARNWLPVEAKLVKLEHQESRKNDKKVIIKVEGAYNYTVAGHHYSSEQINFKSSKYSNVGGFQQELYKQLLTKKDHGIITAYYNPENHSQAVIDRHFPIEDMTAPFFITMALVCGGLMLLWVGFRSFKKTNKEYQYQQSFPNEPWRWKKAWQDEFISPETKSGYVGVGLLSLFILVVTAPVAAIALFQQSDTNFFSSSSILFFPLIGFAIFIWATILYLRHKKFGETKLFINGNRIKIGGLNKGYLLFKNNHFENTDAIIKLASIHRYQTGFGKDRRTHRETLWEDTQRVKLNSAQCDFEFKVPQDLHATDENSSSSKYMWQFSIVSKQKGTDLKIEFNIPAFPMSQEELAMHEHERSDLFSNVDDVETAYQNSERGDWTKTGAIQTVGNLGNEYQFPRSKTWFWLLITLVGITFFGLWLHDVFIKEELFDFIIVGIGGLVIASYSLRSALFKSRLIVDGKGIRLQTGYLKFGETIEIPKEEILRIDSESKLKLEAKKLYNIVILTKDGAKHIIAKNLKVVGDIGAFCQKINRELGL